MSETTTIGFGWGPNGKLRFASSPYLSGGGNETLHWDGDSLLFITDSAGQLVETDVEMLGAIQSTGTSYMQQPATGLIVNDQDLSGTTVGMHYSGHDDFWTYGTAYQQMTSQGYLSQTACICSEYLSGFEPIFDINGQRSDGYLVLGMIFQGPRVYDQNVQQWSQPDAYTGSLDDPMSQRAYTRNRNNLIAYGDRFGYNPGVDANLTDGSITSDPATFAAYETGGFLSLGFLGGVEIIGDLAIGAGGAYAAGVTEDSATAEETAAQRFMRRRKASLQLSPI